MNLYNKTMADITIKQIGFDRKTDINLPNEPFSIFGKLVPKYDNGIWSYSVEKYASKETMRFPDENYDYGAMQSDSFFLGAYAEETCVGLAILQKSLHRYLYLYDLKVNAAYRGKGVGKMLLVEAKNLARGLGYRGIYTQGQDNNLGACMFYLKQGFVIGGLDTKIYDGSPQEGKKDIVFYLDL